MSLEMEITRLALYVTIPRTIYNEEETEMTDFLQIISSSLLWLPVEYPGVGCTPSYELCGYVGPKSLVFDWLWSVKDIHLDHFGLKYLPRYPL